MTAGTRWLAAQQRRERHHDWYVTRKDPIAPERLSWQAHGFRHMVHLLPGETILELGAGAGHFTRALVEMSRGRNPITAVRFDPEAQPWAPEGGPVESVCLATHPDALAGRRFRYVVGLDVLDQESAAEVLKRAYDLLEDGGRLVFYESNPWNPMLLTRNLLYRLVRQPAKQLPISQTKLYELISEVGFIRVSALFSDFVYPPLTGAMIRVLRNVSTLLENSPVLKRFAGRILVHAQKPPREVPREAVSLFRHEQLRDAISIVVPCHNEEMNVAPLVEGLRRHYGPYLHQIILVDDNSRDGTRGVIEGLMAEDSRVVGVFRSPPNGVGRALRDGYARATGAYVLSMDCDFQVLLPELEDLFDAVAEGADVALGSRFSQRSVLINYPFTKIVANRAFHWLAIVLLGRPMRDVTNNLKLMRTEIVRDLVLDEPGFSANAEIGLQLVLRGCRVAEVPISWINRTFDMGQSSFRLVRVGGGYGAVLWRLALRSRFGFRSLGNGQ